MDFDNIPLVLTPFADGDAEKDFSFFGSGITRQMTVPTENGGARFTRHQMNGIGYLATLGAFLDRVGYPYGKERLDPSSFGGYPKGAILMTMDNNVVREYVSLVDNNTHPLPRESADGTYVGDEWWAPTIPTESASFFPSFASATVYKSFVIGPVLDASAQPTVTVDVEDTAWYSIERHFSTSQYVYQNKDFGVLKDTLSLSTCVLNLYMLGEGITNAGEVRAENLNGILGPNASCLIPVSLNQQLRFVFTLTSKSETNRYCHVTIRKLNALEIQ